MTTAEFNIGDSVWFANCGIRDVQHPCPVCFGKRKVRVILGDDSEVETPCDMCVLGFEGTRGFVIEHEWIAKPSVAVITSKRAEEQDGKREVTYQSERHYGNQTDVFATEAEAIARCDAKAAEHATEEKKRREWSKEQSNKSFSWHVGYHMREAKSLRQRLEWHESRAVFCKKRVKEPA